MESRCCQHPFHHDMSNRRIDEQNQINKQTARKSEEQPTIAEKPSPKIFSPLVYTGLGDPEAEQAGALPSNPRNPANRITEAPPTEARPRTNTVRTGMLRSPAAGAPLILPPPKVTSRKSPLRRSNREEKNRTRHGSARSSSPQPTFPAMKVFHTIVEELIREDTPRQREITANDGDVAGDPGENPLRSTDLTEPPIQEKPAEKDPITDKVGRDSEMTESVKENPYKDEDEAKVKPTEKKREMEKTFPGHVDTDTSLIDTAKIEENDKPSQQPPADEDEEPCTLPQESEDLPDMEKEQTDKDAGQSPLSQIEKSTMYSKPRQTDRKDHVHPLSEQAAGEAEYPQEQRQASSISSDQMDQPHVSEEIIEVARAPLPIVKIPVLLATANIEVNLLDYIDLSIPISGIKKIDWTVHSFKGRLLLPSNTVFLKGILTANVELEQDPPFGTMKSKKIHIPWRKTAKIQFIYPPVLPAKTHQEYSFVSRKVSGEQTIHREQHEVFADQIRFDLRGIRVVSAEYPEWMQGDTKLCIQASVNLSLDLLQPQYVNLDQLSIQLLGGKRDV